MNAYALVCPASRRSVLIDPGDEPRDWTPCWRARIRSPFCSPTPTPTTPARWRSCARGCACPSWPTRILQARPSTGRWPTATPSRSANHRLIAHHAPGHTPDQVCFSSRAGRYVSIVGDTIFEGGPGKTWSPEDFRTTLDTLRRVILAWPDETRCYPGHGGPFRLATSAAPSRRSSRETTAVSAGTPRGGCEQAVEPQHSFSSSKIRDASMSESA